MTDERTARFVTDSTNIVRTWVEIVATDYSYAKGWSYCSKREVSTSILVFILEDKDDLKRWILMQDHWRVTRRSLASVYIMLIKFKLVSQLVPTIANYGKESIIDKIKSIYKGQVATDGQTRNTITKFTKSLPNSSFFSPYKFYFPLFIFSYSSFLEYFFIFYLTVIVFLISLEHSYQLPSQMSYKIHFGHD